MAELLGGTTIGGYPAMHTGMPTITLNGTVIANSTGTLYYQGQDTDIRYLTTSANSTLTGKISVGSTSARQAGMYGIYESTKIGHVWSMGSAYAIDANGANFGGLYGLAYKHTNNTTGGTMGGGHQVVWATAGTPRVSLGESGMWTTGNVWWNGGADDLNSLKSSVSSGKTAIASSITAKGISATGSDTHAQLAAKIDQIAPGITGEELVNVIASENITKFDAVHAELLMQAVTSPTHTSTAAQGIHFSHDSTYLALAHQNSPFLTIFKRAGDVFTKLANPVSLPSGYCTGVKFSHDSTYLALSSPYSPYLIIYKRAGDVFTRLPDVNPGNTAYCVEFSHDSTYLVCGYYNSPYIAIYKRAGDVFTRLPNPTLLPAYAGFGLSFSHDSTYLSVVHQYSPFITIYKRSGDTFTKLSNPDVLPPNNGSGTAFSHDSNYLSVTNENTAPYLTIYKRSGDTFTKLPNPEALPTAGAKSVTFSHDSSLMSVGYTISPYLIVYKKSGDVFSKLVNPITMPINYGYAVSFSYDSSYLAVASGSTSSVTIYKNTTGVYKSGVGMNVLTNAMWYGYAKATALSGQSIQIAKLWR